MAIEPDQIAPSSSRTVNDDINVVINWDETVNDRGSEVTAYRITILSKNAIGIEQEQYCKGSEQAIFDARSCSIPVSVLVADPYFLEEGDLVVAQIEALNYIGYSEPSEPNTEGAVIKRRPHMPLEAPRRGASTTDASIEVDFDEVIEDGGSSILQYSLEIDDGSGFAPIAGEAADDTSLSRVVTDGIVSG